MFVVVVVLKAMNRTHGWSREPDPDLLCEKIIALL